VIRLRLLGSVELKGPDGAELRSIIAQPKPMAMLAYLAAATPAGYRRREELLAVFWPELDSSRGRRALSQALHVLRSELPEDAISTRGVEEIGLDRSVIESDVDEFRSAIQAGDSQSAVNLYRGELLSGFLISGSPEFDQWLDKERARLKTQAIDAAWRLSSRSTESGDQESAQRWAKRAIELDPYSEEGMRRLLGLLDKSGNRAEAIRIYEDFRARLKRDLDIEPSSETRGLAQSLRISQPARPPKDPEPGTDHIFVDAVTSMQTGRRRAPLLIGIPLVIAGAIAAMLITQARSRQNDTDSVTAVNRVVIAEFASSSADSTLGKTITEALRLDLSRSHLIKVMSDASARDALALMRRDTLLRITPDVAREVAIRENVKAVLAGDVRRAGNGFALSAQLVSARDGDLISGWRATARDSTELLKAIDQLSALVRRDAGESMKTIAESSPLLRVSTSSLSALRKHAMGLDAFYAEDFRRAVQLFREAVAEDSTFADAHLMLSTILQNSWTHPSEYVESAIKAYRFRDKLRDAERYNVIANYLWAVKGDIPGSVDAHSNVAALDPAIVFWGRYAGQLSQLGRHRDAELAALRGMQWDENPFLYAALANARFRQGKVDEARRTIAYASRKYPGSTLFEAWRIEAAEATGNYHIADSLAHSAHPGANEFPKTHQALIDVIGGKLDEARRHLADVRRAQQATGGFNAEIQTGLLMARLELDAAHDTARALAIADGILAGSSWSGLYPRERPFGSLAHFYVAAGHKNRAQQLLTQYDREVPADFRAKEKWMIRRVRAMLKAAEGDRRAPDEIVEALKTDPAPTSALADLAWSYNQLGMRDDAARAARQYLRETVPRRIEDDAFNLVFMRHLAKD
jgi:DNA-binding SARP family transcriptional activator/TolB-like protein